MQWVLENWIWILFGGGMIVMHLSGSADYKLTPWTSFYLSVKNIANEAYIVARRPAGVRPGLPRTVLGGVKISW